MIKLIKLEWKKNDIGRYIRGALILAALLTAFIFALEFLGIANDPDGTLDAAPGTDVVSAPIGLFTDMAFLIYTGVMLASFIVSAYRDKTMHLMFSYPIKRQKILASQMLAVWSFCLVALVLTKLVICVSVFIGGRSMQPSFAIDLDLGSVWFYVRLVLRSVVVVSMSFIALFVGLVMRSSKATIVTSFLLIFLTQANIGDFTMADNAVFPVVLTVISFGFAVLSLFNVEKKDLL